MTREHWETLPLCPTCRHLSYKLPHNIPHLNFISAYFEAISGISFQYWQLQVLTQGWRGDIILVTWSSLQYCRKCQKWSIHSFKNSHFTWPLLIPTSLSLHNISDFFVIVAVGKFFLLHKIFTDGIHNTLEHSILLTFKILMNEC